MRVTWTAVALLTAWTLPARLTLSTAPFLVNCFENGVSLSLIVTMPFQSIEDSGTQLGLRPAPSGQPAL